MAIFNGTNKVSLSGIDKVYVGNDLVYSSKSPMYFTALEDTEISVKITGTLSKAINFYYLKNDGEWTQWFNSTSGTSSTISLTTGDILYVWNKTSSLFNYVDINKENLLQSDALTSPSESSSKYVSFVITSGSVDVAGDITSLCNYDDISEAAFYSLFINCNIVNANNLKLPSITENECYYRMFYGCTKLISIPVINAEYIRAWACAAMFQGCTSLIAVTSLSSPILYGQCYYRMFYGCTSLKELPSSLPSLDFRDEDVYESMFEGCTSLESIPNGFLPNTSIYRDCYASMFYGCTSLTTVPADLLPATTLADRCYASMFYGCTSLTTAPELPATTLTEGCYYTMFSGCKSLKVNENGTEGTTIFTCPDTTGEFSLNPVYQMFFQTGGTFTGIPTAGNTYKYY